MVWSRQPASESESFEWAGRAKWVGKSGGCLLLEEQEGLGLLQTLSLPELLRCPELLWLCQGQWAFWGSVTSEGGTEISGHTGWVGVAANKNVL